MFRTGPIRNFAPADITVVACVLALEAPDPTDHTISFSVVSLDHSPVVIYEENAVVVSGEMVEFEVTLARSVRRWEVRVGADPDPDLVFVTIYHLRDGQSDPHMTFRAGELYYVDLIDPDENDGDDSAGFFWEGDGNDPFFGPSDPSSHWPSDGEDDVFIPWW